MLLFLLLLQYRKRRPSLDRQSTTIATRDKSTCHQAGSAFYLPWAMHMYKCLAWQIPAPSWSEGHEVHMVCGGL